MRLFNKMIIVLFLILMTLQITLIYQEIHALNTGLTRGVVMEIAPNIYLYIDPEPIAVYRDECGYVPIYHYRLAPYGFFSPYEEAFGKAFREMSKGDKPVHINVTIISASQIINDIKRIFYNANITYKTINSIPTPQTGGYLLEAIISIEDTEKILSISKSLSAYVSKYNSKLFIRAVSPETFDIDKFIRWSDERYIEIDRAIENVLREYSSKIGRDLGKGTGIASGSLPIISIFILDHKEDLSTNQIIELGFQIAKAVRNISGCKLFAIVYEGPPPVVTPLPLTITRTSTSAIDYGQESALSYKSYILIMVVVLATLLGYFIIRKRFSSNT
jgi:tetrahydromethanopterin S-methyltransferase subunit G